MKSILLFCCLLAYTTLFGQSGGTPHDRWAYFFNSKIDNIDSVYLPDAILLSPAGEIYTSAKVRKDFYRGLRNSIGKITSTGTINKTEITPDLSYEIGFFITSKNIKYKHLIIWKNKDGVLLRALELLSESKNETDLKGIAVARNQWMDWCNSHQVNELVSKGYAENAVYYTNNRLTTGTGNIAKEYRYMNNPSYQLTLTPLILEAVTENLAFEIGQCSGSYQGKYTLVWGKRNGSSWKVIFDSN